jgi:hypothetical protein
VFGLTRIKKREKGSMLEELSIDAKYYYHNLLSFLMVAVWFIIAIKGHKLTDYHIKYKISIGIIAVCFFQEFIDFINRIFLDSNYFFSIQRDIPLLQFCQISFYFSLLCIFLRSNKERNDSGYSL